MDGIEAGLRAAGVGMIANLGLAFIKILVGVVGNSYALIADGIESTTDILSSFVVWSGIQISSRPPDERHPYGHGKAESLAAVTVSLALLGAAALIASQSVREILTPHHAPAWFTLVALALVVVAKETLFRFVFATGDSLASNSLRADAWHHRSDAITSAAAFVGISVALIGGEGYEAADDWAALLACGVIVYNGLRLLRPAVHEVMDGAAGDGARDRIRSLTERVEGVKGVEKCRVRKSGMGLYTDIHVEVDGAMTVREGHEVAGRVKHVLLGAGLRIADVVVHIEPARESEITRSTASPGLSG